MPQHKILISGAGIAGLTAAVALAQQGHEITVIERASSIRAGGFLVSLSDSAYDAITELGLSEALHDFDMGITHSSYHDSHGKQLLKMRYERIWSRLNIVQIMRDDLNQILFDAARAHVDVRFETELSSVEATSGEVTFNNGDSSQFDFVVVAEGQNSTTRDQLLAGQVSRDYLNLACAAFRLTNSLGLENKFETHMERDRYMAAFTTGHGDLGAVFVWHTEDRVKGRDAAESLHAAFSSTEVPAILEVLKSVANAPGDPPIYMDDLFQVHMTPWHQHKVVAIGDASNCLTLFSGRGAGTAVTSAADLAANIKLHGIELGPARFELNNRKRIEQIQSSTRAAVSMYVPRSKTRQWLRDTAMRCMPSQVFEQYFQYKYRSL